MGGGGGGGGTCLPAAWKLSRVCWARTRALRDASAGGVEIGAIHLESVTRSAGKGTYMCV